MIDQSYLCQRLAILRKTNLGESQLSRSAGDHIKTFYVSANAPAPIFLSRRVPLKYLLFHSSIETPVDEESSKFLLTAEHHVDFYSVKYKRTLYTKTPA